MKTAVIKLGARISFNARDTSGGNGEARSICKMLKMGGADVHIFTKILDKDNLVPDFTWHNIADDCQKLDGYDALVIINGTVQFYGGAEDYEQLLNYCMINRFKGKVFYVFCDPSLTLKQVWPSVTKKPWASNWTEEQLNIVRKDIVYISQPFDVDKVVGKLKGNEVIPSKIIHYPFEQFPCLNESIPLNHNPEVHLSYGGTMRGGKRQKKMAKFYFGLPDFISVEMFGKIDAEDFDQKHIDGLRHPAFTGPVKYDDMLPKMNKAMAHVVIGDPWYEQINDIPQRLYESVMAGVITFVDHDMDKNRRIFKNLDKETQDFIYVKDRVDLAEKLQYLISFPEGRKQIHDKQVKAINFNGVDYCQSFVQILKSN